MIVLKIDFAVNLMTFRSYCGRIVIVQSCSRDIKFCVKFKRLEDFVC